MISKFQTNIQKCIHYNIFQICIIILFSRKSNTPTHQFHYFNVYNIHFSLNNNFSRYINLIN